MDASCKANGKNNKTLAPFGMKERLFVEYQFICGSIFAAWNQCLAEDGRIESVIQGFNHIRIYIAYIAYCIFGSLWINASFFTKMLTSMEDW